MLVVLEPLDLARTNFVTYTLAKKLTLEADGAGVERDSDFVTAGTKEDRAVVESIQRGLGSGANTVFTFGHYESAFAHFHRTLHSALGEELSG